jgi:quercetin dioxygenase-like cupin family protein
MTEQPLIDCSKPAVLSLEKETGFAPQGIVSRTLLRTANSRVVLFGFAAGQELTEHTSTQQATVQVLSGECEFDLGPQTHHLKAGDYVYMPPGQPHALRAARPFSMLLSLVRPEASITVAESGKVESR